MLEPVIGLEIHVQLNTKTKMFCWDKNDPFEADPNVHICPICLGHPGTLPVPNQAAIDKVVQVGLALGGKINRVSYFDRKNYFYPDLPKGYQISQYETPLVKGGFLYLPQSGREIRIRRIHLEEDTGKMLHQDGQTLLDFNRAGVPLMELVTEPDLASAEEASEFAKELQLILRYLKAAEADMEKGQMRVEANISLLPRGQRSENSDRGSRIADRNAELARQSKVELKNLNSFKAVRDAVAYEISRQTKLLEKGEAVIQETRGWNPEKNRTFTQRVKETESDYRYFPEPDIPPIKIRVKKLQEIEARLPELPAARRERFQQEYGLPPADARALVSDRQLAEFFENVASETQVWEKVTEEKQAKAHQSRLMKLAANFLINEAPNLIGARPDWENFPITSENFAEFVVLVHQGKVSSSAASRLLKAMYERGGEPDHLMQELDLEQVSDEAQLQKAIHSVLEQNKKAQADYRQGKENALQFLVGQVMAHTKGKANPQKVREMLKKNLKG